MSGESAYTVNRPEPEAMERLLKRHDGDAAGTILRLAWLQGLVREELRLLTWDRVSFLDHTVELEDRTMPMEGELEAYLRRLWARWARVSEYVVFSQRYRKELQPQAVSRLARRVLDEEGQTRVRLVDLRHDYIIRQLQKHPIAYVAQITGMGVRPIQVHFSPYLDKAVRPTLRGPRDPEEIDEFRLWKILQAERDTAAGLGLWLTWQTGLSGTEIVELTWDQVDFEAGVLRLPDREVPLGGTARQLLLDRRERREGSDPHVLLSERAGKPMDLSRLSRAARGALIRGGMDQVTLRDLYRSGRRGDGEGAVLELVRERGAVSRSEVMEALGLTGAAAYRRLRRMSDERKLVRVGGKYYLPGSVVPPEEQSAVIRAYLEKEGFAYRQDIAGLLHVQSQQCAVILKRLVEAGELVQVRQRYYLKEA